MEHRKLIKSGKSSLIVSLPNEWVKRNKLDKGDEIYFEEVKSNELILKTDYIEKEKDSKIIINTKGKDDARIEREIMSAYINNYSTIEVIGGIKSLQQIEEIIHNLIGLDVIEQTSDKIIIKNFLDPGDISLKDSLRRLDTTIRSMMIDTKECISGKMSYEEIYRRDANVNKTRVLIFTLLRNPTMIPKIEKEFENENISSLELWFLTFNMEIIADESKRIAKYSSKLSNNERKEIRKIYEIIEESYLETIKAFYKKDKELAHNAAFKKYDIIQKCRNLLEKVSNKSAIMIIEKLKGMEGAVRDIARIVIDLR